MIFISPLAVFVCVYFPSFSSKSLRRWTKEDLYSALLHTSHDESSALLSGGVECGERWGRCL